MPFGPCVVVQIDLILKRGDPFDLAQEASSLGLTRDHLAPLFHEATGQTRISYSQSRRIQEACIRLVDPNSNLIEVAYSLNFADSTHFIRSLRKQKSMSPS